MERSLSAKQAASRASRSTQELQHVASEDTGLLPHERGDVPYKGSSCDWTYRCSYSRDPFRGELNEIYVVEDHINRRIVQPRIRNPIIQRVYDASPSVRDAAVEVLAIYLSGLSEVPRKIYEILSKRIMDTAVNVRRRMVKLLRDLFYKCDDHEIKVDIVSKLVQRTNDNEVTVCDLALKTCQEVLFQPFHEIDKDGDDYFGYSYGNSSKARKQKISALTKIIMDAVANLDTTVSNQTNALAQLVQKVRMEQNSSCFRYSLEQKSRLSTMQITSSAHGLKRYRNGLWIVFLITC